MRNWIWVGFLGVLAVVAGVTSNWPLMQHVGWAVLGIVLLGYVLAWTGRRGIQVETVAERRRYTVGERLTYQYRVKKRSFFPAFDIRLPEGSALSLLPLGHANPTFDTPLEYRGNYAIGGSVALSRDPFGLFTMPAAAIPQQPVIVHPRPLRTPEAAAAANRLIRRHRSWVGQAADATVGDLRVYQSGDPPQRVHWRTSARVGQLVVSWPERERRSSVWLLLDLGGDGPAAEDAAGIATFLVHELSGARIPVGLIVAGESLSVVAPRLDPDQRRRLLDAIATINTSAASRIDGLVREFGRASGTGSCVLITPLNETAAWARRLRAMTSDLAVLHTKSA
ncbi:MAG TPA: DUF58 domain-containing protein [Chloroflexota bacterium]|nr:DUF58 domain-containing protein [Chloroflexota bacterium]